MLFRLKYFHGIEQNLIIFNKLLNVKYKNYSKSNKYLPHANDQCYYKLQ